MPVDGPLAGRRPRLGWWLLLCAGVALWIDFGSLHRLHHSDSLLPVLVSLYHWTPYYWGQDRYGMLVPLVAVPVSGPLENLLTQGFLSVFCGLSVFFLLARYTLRDATYPVVGAVGAAAFLSLSPPAYRFDYFIDSAPCIWLALGLGGLIALEPGSGGTPWSRRVIAMALIALAHWVNFATALYLGALVGFRALLLPSSWWPWQASSQVDNLPIAQRLPVLARRLAGSEPGQALILLGLGAVVGRWLTRLSPYHQTSLNALAMAEWPEAWWHAFGRTWSALAPQWWPVFLVLSAVVGLVAGRLLGGRWPSPSAWRAAAVLAASALAVGLFVGTRRWVKINVFVPRYLIPSVIFAQAAFLTIAIAPFRDFLEARLARRVGWVLSAAALLGAATIGYGIPGPGRPQADLDRAIGSRTADILEARCTHVAGDYWAVWSSVFHANMVAHQQGQRRVIWGVTFRSAPITSEIEHVPLESLRVAVPLGDGVAENWLRAYLFPTLVEAERRPTIRVLSPETPITRPGRWGRLRARESPFYGPYWFEWLRFWL